MGGPGRWNDRCHRPRTGGVWAAAREHLAAGASLGWPAQRPSPLPPRSAVGPRSSAAVSARVRSPVPADRDRGTGEFSTSARLRRPLHWLMTAALGRRRLHGDASPTRLTSRPEACAVSRQQTAEAGEAGHEEEEQEERRGNRVRDAPWCDGGSRRPRLVRTGSLALHVLESHIAEDAPDACQVSVQKSAVQYHPFRSTRSLG
jgi:hypothetical protein